MRNREITTDKPFQPTLPVWGETLFFDYVKALEILFQPTLPVWGETFNYEPKVLVLDISTHSPRVGRD